MNSISPSKTPAPAAASFSGRMGRLRAVETPSRSPIKPNLLDPPCQAFPPNMPPKCGKDDRRGLTGPRQRQDRDLGIFDLAAERLLEPIDALVHLGDAEARV